MTPMTAHPNTASQSHPGAPMTTHTNANPPRQPEARTYAPPKGEVRNNAAPPKGNEGSHPNNRPPAKPKPEGHEK